MATIKHLIKYCFGFILFFLILIYGLYHNDIFIVRAQDHSQKSVKVTRQDIVSEVFYHGEIDYLQKMKITSQISDKISLVNINIGDKVKKSDILIQFNSQNIEHQIAQISNQIEQLSHWVESNYPAEKEALIATNVILEKEIDFDEKSKRSTLSALLKAHEEQIASQDEIKEAENDLSLTLSQIKIKRAEQKIKEAQLESQRLDNQATTIKLIKEKEDFLKTIEKYTVMAPFDGIIMALNNNIHDPQLKHVETNEFLITIVNQNSKILKVLLPEAEVYRLINEKNNICIIPRHNTEMPCTLISVSVQKTLQGVDEYIVQYDLLEQVRSLAVGEMAEIHLKQILKKNALAVPITSLVKNNNITGVMLLSNGKKVFTPVTLGAFSKDYVEILSGLQLEQEIIIP